MIVHLCNLKLPSQRAAKYVLRKPNHDNQKLNPADETLLRTHIEIYDYFKLKTFFSAPEPEMGSGEKWEKTQKSI